MCIFKKFPLFSGCTRWVELETVYSLDRIDEICAFLTENHIPHKVRAALLPAGANTVFPAVGTARCGICPYVKRMPPVYSITCTPSGTIKIYNAPACFLYAVGDRPVFSLKHLPKWLRWLKPHSAAMVLTGALVVRRWSAARDRRTSIKY